MHVVFEDEVEYMRHLKIDNGTKLRVVLSKINDDDIISRMFEYSLKMLKPFAFKTIFFERPWLLPKDPLTTITSVFVNYKGNRNCDKYVIMIDSAVEIYKFLDDFNIISKYDMDRAYNWACYAQIDDLMFLI